MATYKPNIPGGQLITFDEKRCGTDCLIIGNAPYCGDNPVVNHNFMGYWSGDWTVVRGSGTKYSPALIDLNVPTSDIYITQDFTLADGDYVIFYSFTNSNSLGNLTGTVHFDAASTTLFTSVSDDTITGTQAVTVNWSGSGTFAIEIDSTNTNTIVQLNYLFICPATGWTPDQDLCFQAPLFSTGAALIDESVTYTQEFNDTTNYNFIRSTTTLTCGAPLSYSNNAGSNAISTDGKYFHVINLGDVTINWALNPDDDTSKELLMMIGGINRFSGTPTGAHTPPDQVAFNAGDANSAITIYDQTAWTTSVDPLMLLIYGKQECDGTNEVLDYTANVTNWAAYPLFYSTTANLSDDTFYKISYTLNKTSGTTCEITDSASGAILTAASDGVKFEKIFKTGTLPSATVTFKITVNDFLDYPNANFNTDVITNFEVIEMCAWDMSLEDVDGNSIIAALTETHDTTAESQGTSYHKNIEYCFDTGSLSGSCATNKYKIRATKECNTDAQYLSNCLQVCDADCELSQIAWTPGVVICSGNDIIDYETYPSTHFFWAKVDVQDMTIERDREIYRRADGFWEMPYTYQHTIEILQIWPMPPHVRLALSVGMTGTFKINGIEYEVINEDEIAPMFNAVYEAPVRIPVHKVGEFTLKR